MVPEFKSWQPRMWRGKYIILCDIMFTHEDFLRRHWQGLEELERALWRRWSLELVRSSEGLEKRREEKTSRFCSKNEFARCGELWGEEPARADGTRQAANRLKIKLLGRERLDSGVMWKLGRVYLLLIWSILGKAGDVWIREWHNGNNTLGWCLLITTHSEEESRDKRPSHCFCFPSLIINLQHR